MKGNTEHGGNPRSLVVINLSLFTKDMVWLADMLIIMVLKDLERVADFDFC